MAAIYYSYENHHRFQRNKKRGTNTVFEYGNHYSCSIYEMHYRNDYGIYEDNIDASIFRVQWNRNE
jgi:hypothetical protein